MSTIQEDSSRARHQHHRSPTICKTRQVPSMSGIKRERWTESDVVQLPAGEHDYFDRKSGALLSSHKWRDTLSKALSAFANSGGGHIILGMCDDCTFDGVAPLRSGRTTTREWLEQVVPHLLTYPLEDFRVHVVEAASPSAIPTDKQIIVIDIGDSVLAPHQAAESMGYFYRAGGHSRPAPHFYLETLRNRLVNPSLSGTLIAIEFLRAQAYSPSAGSADPMVCVEARLVFNIANSGSVAAYKWKLQLEALHHHGDRVDFYWSKYEYPTNKSKDRTIALGDRTILPTLETRQNQDFGFSVRKADLTQENAVLALQEIIRDETSLSWRVVSETSPGELAGCHLAQLIDFDDWAKRILQNIS